MLGLREKVSEGRESCHEIGERDGYLRLPRRRAVWPAVDDEIPKLGMEGSFHLLHGSTEGDPATARRDFVDAQAVTLEPIHDSLDVIVGDSELPAVLLRREPLVVTRGDGVLLFGEEPLEPLPRSGPQVEE